MSSIPWRATQTQAVIQIGVAQPPHTRAWAGRARRAASRARSRRCGTVAALPGRRTAALSEMRRALAATPRQLPRRPRPFLRTSSEISELDLSEIWERSAHVSASPPLPCRLRWRKAALADRVRQLSEQNLAPRRLPMMGPLHVAQADCWPAGVAYSGADDAPLFSGQSVPSSVSWGTTQRGRHGHRSHSSVTVSAPAA